MSLYYFIVTLYYYYYYYTLVILVIVILYIRSVLFPYFYPRIKSSKVRFGKSRFITYRYFIYVIFIRLKSVCGGLWASYTPKLRSCAVVPAHQSRCQHVGQSVSNARTGTVSRCRCNRHFTNCSRTPSSGEQNKKTDRGSCRKLNTTKRNVNKMIKVHR